jgi:hypothetical protein
MSNKDNWDDESGDEEGDAPPDPLYEAKEEYHAVQFEGDLLRLHPDPLEPEESEEDEFVDAKASDEGVVGGHPLEEYPDEEDYEDEDEDYEDELDDYDKKLGRYVSCR